MPVHFDIRPVVQKHSALPMGCLRVVNKFEDADLLEIRRGIIFIFAAWSAPSISAFHKFTKIMSETRTDSLELIVLDIDCLSAESAAKLFSDTALHLGGWGEVLWIRNGCIVSRAVSHYENEQSLRDHTMALLVDDPVSEG